MTDKKTTVGFISLGCPKNMVDSERMLAEISQADLLISADPDDADVVVINTCGFIAPAKAEATEAIKHAVACKRKGKIRKVIVAGCLAQRMGPELLNEVKGIDAIVGLGERDKIAEIIKKTLTSGEAAAYLEHACQLPLNDKTRLRITPKHWAYLRISEGCDHRCAFCTIPSIRGRFKSKPLEMITAEAKELADSGVVELNLIAQDTSYYGKDLKIKDGLSVLIKELEKITGAKWLRLLYLYPTGITDTLLETIAASEKVVHYFDIPLQHINNAILKNMRRPDTNEQIYKLIEKIRIILPDAVLRTTLIVGLPGETEKEFEELLDFIKWAGFDCLGCFKYYAETSTAAAQMPGQVPEKIKEQRAQQLMLTQQQIAFDINKFRMGTQLSCLLDSVQKGIGRFYGQAPEIDSVCIIKNCTAKPGTFLNANVIGTKDYDLVVKQV
jgi:ribosomal protein S12 methylthiotransferase